MFSTYLDVLCEQNLFGVQTECVRSADATCCVQKRNTSRINTKNEVLEYGEICLFFFARYNVEKIYICLNLSTLSFVGQNGISIILCNPIC